MAAVIIAFPAAAQTLAWTGPSRTWSAENGSETKYTYDDVTLTISAVREAGKSGPRLDVVAKNGAWTTIYGSASSEHQYARFNVVRLDPEFSTIDVVFATYSGGAHCCTEIKVLQLFSQWTVVDLGSWGGGPENIINQPRDVTGNGRLEFVRDDERFFNTFCSYVGCEMPFQVLRVEDGVLLDVSAQRRFADLYWRDMEQNRCRCAEGRNGACAAFVASAVRAGKYKSAWDFMLQHFMLQHYDRNDKHGLEMAETEYGAGLNRQLAFDDFPTALKWFLTDTGYLTPE